MKRVLPILILWLPLSCMADGYGGARGKNSLGEIVYIGEDTARSIYVEKNKQDHDWAEHYDFAAECPTSTHNTFSCPPGRKSPLSGSTYKITTSKKWRPCNVDPFYDKSPGEVYVCVKGCDNKRVPKIFYVNPWEC